MDKIIIVGLLSIVFGCIATIVSVSGSYHHSKGDNYPKKVFLVSVSLFFVTFSAFTYVANGLSYSGQEMLLLVANYAFVTLLVSALFLTGGIMFLMFYRVDNLTTKKAITPIILATALTTVLVTHYNPSLVDAGHGKSLLVDFKEKASK